MKHLMLFAVLTFLLLAGCAAPVKMITLPTEPLDRYKQFMILKMNNDVIGKIDTSVVHGIISESVERIHDLNYFDSIIVDDGISISKIQSTQAIVRRSVFSGDSVTVAVMQVTLTDYNEGDPLLRFFFAPFAGMGKVGCDILITNEGTKKELLHAKTSSQVGGLSSGADQVITPISKAITNVVDRFFVQHKKK